MFLTLNEILTWIIVGGIAGLLAEWLIGGINVDCIGTVIVGIVGGFIGGWLFGLLHVSIGVTGLVSDIITAFIGGSSTPDGNQAGAEGIGDHTRHSRGPRISIAKSEESTKCLMRT